MFTLGDDLTGVELCNDALEDLVDDGREDTLVIVCTQLSVDGGQSRDVGAGEHTARNVDHLEICGRPSGHKKLTMQREASVADAPLVPVSEAIFRGFARMS